MDERMIKQKTLAEQAKDKQGQADLVSPMLESWEDVDFLLGTDKTAKGKAED